MRLLHILSLFCLLPSTGFSNNITEYDRQVFIDDYAMFAVEQMKRNSIPASIILAQAIIESNWGTSDIARKANNFFCIKCNNGWTGPSHKAKDDEPGLSCFRKYDSVWESFRDHSEFLTKNIRYRPLFGYSLTDYRSWAVGLKACGYATDEQYAEKLIGVIENYGLDMYDFATPLLHFRLLDAPPAPTTETEGIQPAAGEADNLVPADTPVSVASYAAQQPIDVPFYKADDNAPSRWQQVKEKPATPSQRIEKPVDHAHSSIRPLYPVPKPRLSRR